MGCLSCSTVPSPVIHRLLSARITRSTVLIVPPEQTRSLEVDTRLLTWLKPLLVGLGASTALLTAGLVGLGAQHLIWETGAPVDGPGPVRIVVTILIGGALLILLARISPSETVDELLDDADQPWVQSWKKILLTALAATVAVAFGDAVPCHEAGGGRPTAKKPTQQ